LIIFRPGNGSLSATNVVLVVVFLVLDVVVSTKAFSFHNRSSSKLHTQIGDNIVHNLTVSDFQVNYLLIIDF